MRCYVTQSDLGPTHHTIAGTIALPGWPKPERSQVAATGSYLAVNNPDATDNSRAQHASRVARP